MPSKSQSQHKLMNAAAHNKAFAEKVGVPTKVAKEFAEADKERGKKALGRLPNKVKTKRGRAWRHQGR